MYCVCVEAIAQELVVHCQRPKNGAFVAVGPEGIAGGGNPLLADQIGIEKGESIQHTVYPSKTGREKMNRYAISTT